jgi:aldehyde:ferredoxin oxidoreductase
MGDSSFESQLLSAVTGNEFTEEALNLIGERVWNLSRVIMATEGRTREQDTLHESYFTEHQGLKAIPKLDFEEAKTRYYRLRGWNETTGLPTREKLVELNLPEIAEGLSEKK